MIDEIKTREPRKVYLQTRKEALGGDRDAQFRVGYMCERGRGVGQNYRNAISWYKKAAKQGHDEAQNRLGFMYLMGMGMLRSSSKIARHWFEKAANQGNSNAQFNLFELYDNGDRWVDKDDKQAMFWCKKAAEQGHVQAQSRLAVVYKLGLGVKKNMSKARFWHDKATKHLIVSISTGYAYHFLKITENLFEIGL